MMNKTIPSRFDATMSMAAPLFTSPERRNPHRSTMDASPSAYLTSGASDASLSPMPASAIDTKPSELSWRERRRQSERKSREKRKGTVNAMRLQLQALECAAANIHRVMNNTDIDGQDDNDNDDNRRMQNYLRKSMALAVNARRLVNANSELCHMLQESELAVRTLRILTKGMVVDEWSQKTERWRAMTMALFTPWTEHQAWQVVQESMEDIAKFQFDGTVETSGLSFMGWRDRRKLNAEAGTVQFQFSKRHVGFDAEEMARRYWEMHLDGPLYAKCMLGPSVKVYFDVVQHISPSMCIVRYVEQYTTAPITIHLLFLIFRVHTDTGMLMGLRAIPCPELVATHSDDGEFWNNNFHWVKWDIVERDDQGQCVQVETSVNGTLASTSTEYANRWMGEAILSLVRAESVLLGRQFLKG